MTPYSQRLIRVLELCLLAVFVLVLVRAENLLWNRAQFAGQPASLIGLAFLTGLRFDFSTTAWLTAPLWLVSLIPWPVRFEVVWRRTILTIFLVLQLPFLLLNFIDIELVNFVGRRLTADVLFILEEAQGKVGGFVETYWSLMLVWACVTAFLVVASVRIVGAAAPRAPRWLPRGRVARVVFAVLCLIGVVIATRGGLQKKPLHFVNANVFSQPQLNNVVLNTGFVLLKSLGQEKLPRPKYFENHDEMMAHLNGAIAGPSLLEGRRVKGTWNVVVLILESFGTDYLGNTNGKSYTPFLDSLARESLSFPNGIANSRRSIEGVPAVLSGVPALMNEPFITSTFASDRVPALGNLLGAKGYDTAFFHGGHNGTMHFDGYAQGAGFAHYFGASEYPNAADDDGVWGIYDGPFLRWMNEKISSLHEPFAVGYFSLSSHQPFSIPTNLRPQYPEGPVPILKTVKYTDDALRSFFEQARGQAWFPHTLFVITADHTSIPYQAKFNNELGHFRVPILFYAPGFSWPSGIDREQPVQQIDILPSIQDFLGLPSTERNWLARSVFVPGERSATAFVDGTYLEVGVSHFVVWARGEDAKVYAIDDAAQAHGVSADSTLEGRNLFLRLKAAIQYFSEGLWENRLVR